MYRYSPNFNYFSPNIAPKPPFTNLKKSPF
jgi:hypothetical protein